MSQPKKTVVVNVTVAITLEVNDTATNDDIECALNESNYYFDLQGWGDEIKIINTQIEEYNLD